MKTYLRILAYGRPYFGQGILAFGFLFLYNFFGVFTVSLVIPILRILFLSKEEAVSAIDNGSGIMTEVYEQLGGWIAEYGRWNVLLGFSLTLLICILAKNSFRYLGRFHMAPVEEGVIKEMRNKIFSHLGRLSMDFFTGKKKGQIINVVVSDVQVVQQAVISTLHAVISEPLNMILIIVFLFAISWKLTLVTLLVLPVTGFFISRIAKSLRKRARRGQERLGDLISVVEEFVGGIRIVKSFRAEEFATQKYQNENEGYRREIVGFRRRADLASPVTEVLAMIVITGIILFGGSLIISGDSQLAPDAFIGFVALFGTFIAPIRAFSNALSKIQKGIASFVRIEDFLNIPETVQESDQAIEKKSFEDRVEYKDVHFSYEEEEVLGGISFSLAKGETVALVGPSGGGKSTIADLLPRFYDPDSGKIEIDGMDIRDYKVHDLRSLFGIVAQEGILFNDTITANIAFGDASPDLERVREAARVANALEFIEAQPNGFGTRIGERGGRLSGGQQQRIAIARAIYRNPPVLILDEATSALDVESERLVQNAMDNLMSGRTVLVIAHRLSTIQEADKILVVDGGQIVESGKHSELVNSGGLYRKLHDIQFYE